MLNKKTQLDVFRRLNRIRGQVEGIKHMVEETRYCIDIINQITAVRRALEQVSLLIMEQHIKPCVSEEIKKGGSTPRIKELIYTIDNFIR